MKIVINIADDFHGYSVDIEANDYKVIIYQIIAYSIGPSALALRLASDVMTILKRKESV